MKKRILCSCFLLLLLLGAGVVHARSVYVSDSFEITMRTGPGNTNKILKMLDSGDRLQVLDESEGWLKVQAPDGKEGWVLKRFTMAETPKAIQVTRLKRENERLENVSQQAVTQARTLEEKNEELTSALEQTRSELEETSAQYADLRQDAASVMELKKEYASTQERLKTVTARVEELSQENKELKSSSSLRWFLSGAGVVFGAWLFGFIMGRIQRRKRSSIQF